MEFTNLNVKTHYSLLHSTLKTDDIINFALTNKMKYVAVCDYNFLGSVAQLITEANKYNLQVIIGLDIIIKKDEQKFYCLLYAKNNQGFKNLQKLSSIVMTSKDKTLDYEIYLKYSNDLSIVLDLIRTDVYQEYLLNNNLNIEQLNELKETFDDYYYWFSQDNDLDYINLVQQLNPSKQLAITNVFYHESEDYPLYDMLRCLDEGRVIDKTLTAKKGSEYLKTASDVIDKYNDTILKNTSDFIRGFDPIDLEVNKTLPLYKNSLEHDNGYLKQLALKGLLRRLKTTNPNKEYLERLQYELSTIIRMGYSSYFLIVYDYVLFAKKNNILVGPGRGSAAGSLVAYCLGITNVDPLANGLIFERFLNPERISMPDIDVDFQDNRREEIISYLKDKYQQNCVAHIITYGTFQAKNSIKDLGRVLEIPNQRLDLVLKLIPNVLNVRLVELLQQSKQLQVILEANSDLKFIYQNAIKLEGVNRHVSTHAAGVVLTDQDLTNYLPVMNGINDTLMVQYSMDYLEPIGLYKMDILGLKNLSILDEILNDVNEDDILDNLALDDAKTLELLSNGNTLGVFQFESAGVIKVLKKMGIDSINDLVATTALFRPGPMQFIDEYIARKKDLKKIDYLHPDLKPILEETYGIIVYQEQIMQICQVMANFTLAKADTVRKGMSKKDEKILVEIKEDFVVSAQANGYSKEVAIKVYDMILKFSNYGFNKAHAYSYALLGYYLAYLKANYPLSFFKCVLSANLYSISKIKSYLYEMKQYDLDIKVPDINKSKLTFVSEKDSFILPFTAIKGMGEINATAIINERETNGLYLNYFDAMIRLLKIKVARKNIENLIYAGALDSFELTRKTMIENIEKIEKYLMLTKGQDDQTYLNLGFITKPHIVKFVEDANVSQKEYELLGLYLANHPLNRYIQEYPDNILANISHDHMALVIIDSIREIRTKAKGELMAFIIVSDLIESRTLVVFPNIYKQYKASIKNKDVVLVTGRIDEKDSSNIILNSLVKVRR